MSAEDVVQFQPPNPNTIKIYQHFQTSFPRPPTDDPFWNRAKPTLTSDDKIITLWGKEFKFIFELTFTFPETLNMVNKCSRAVWIGPRKVNPNGKVRVNFRRDYNNQDIINVNGDFFFFFGVDYDPEPSLQQSLVALLREEKFTDFRLKCGDEEFPCHKGILAARSSVLAEAFNTTDPTDEHEFTGHNFNPNPSDIGRILDHIYSGVPDEDDGVPALADYLDIKMTREQFPGLKQLRWSGNHWNLEGWITFSLQHQTQIEPLICAKNNKLTWTIHNFNDWRALQATNHTEKLPEKRITFLGKEFVFEGKLRLGNRGKKAYWVTRSEGLPFFKSNNYNYYNTLVRFSKDTFYPATWELKKNGDLIVVSSFTMVEFLNLDNESQLQQDLLALLEDSLNPAKFADFKICVGEAEFPCHRAILAARSPGFDRIFRENTGTHQLEIVDFKPAKVKQMLEFIYSDKVMEEGDQDLLRLAEKFQIRGLIKLCGRSIAKTVKVENALCLLDLANSQPDGLLLKNLKDSVLDFCANNYWELKRTEQWHKTSRKNISDISDFVVHTYKRPAF